MKILQSKMKIILLKTWFCDQVQLWPVAAGGGAYIYMWSFEAEIGLFCFDTWLKIHHFWYENPRFFNTQSLVFDIESLVFNSKFITLTTGGGRGGATGRTFVDSNLMISEQYRRIHSAHKRNDFLETLDLFISWNRYGESIWDGCIRIATTPWTSVSTLRH